MTGAGAANRGSAVISEGRVDQGFLPGAASFAPVALQFDAASSTLQGFGAHAVTVTDSAGAQSAYAAGAAVPFSAGASYAFGGVTLSFKGQPIDGDTFSVARNSAAVGDNRNMALMGDLQARPVLNERQRDLPERVRPAGQHGRQQGARSADQRRRQRSVLARASTEQQNVSGVNLDEEAANLLKYQQACRPPAGRCRSPAACSTPCSRSDDNQG
jgi:flagellar hook-associated protein 1 FlgK